MLTGVVNLRKDQVLIEHIAITWFKLLQTEWYMIVFSEEDGYKSGVLMLFDNTVTYIATALQVGELSGEQEGARALTNNNAKKLIYKFGKGKDLQDRDNRPRTSWLVQSLRELVQRSSKAGVCLLLRGKASFIVLNGICQKRPDGKIQICVIVKMSLW